MPLKTFWEKTKEVVPLFLTIIIFVGGIVAFGFRTHFQIITTDTEVKHQGLRIDSNCDSIIKLQVKAEDKLKDLEIKLSRIDTKQITQTKLLDKVDNKLDTVIMELRRK